MNSHLLRATIDTRVSDLRRDATSRRIAASAAGQHRTASGRIGRFRYRFRLRSLRADVA
jgi:hypothetical protein